MLGAGVDVVYGVPTVATLLRTLASFVKEKGAPIDKALRSKLPNLRFTFDKFADDQGDDLLRHLFESSDDLVPTLMGAAAKLRTDEAMTPVAEVIERLCTMATSNQISSASLEGLAKLTGHDGAVGEAEPLLDPQRLALTRLPGEALRAAFHQALIRGDQLSDEEREVFGLFVEATSNIEELLSTYFTLFMAGRAADRKTYLYLVWMLWAYLRFRSANRATIERSIYPRLREIGGEVITFNYTNFFPDTLSRSVRFFHGRLDRYLRMDDRELVTDDRSLARAIDVPSIVSFLEARRLDLREGLSLDLPAIVPPTSFKPVLTREQLRTWVEADDVLHNAPLVVVTGYSFASADEHFNDLLRRSSARVLVVNPDFGLPLRNACHVLNLSSDGLEVTEKDCFKFVERGRLSFVAAPAEEVDASFIDRMSR